MPYSKDPSTYPIEFAKLFDRAQREAFELDVGDHGEAQAFRHKLHAFRRAVELAKLPGFAMMRNITLKVRGTRVLFTNNNELMAAIRDAAGVEAPTEAALESYMKQAFEGDTDAGDERRSIPSPVSGEQEVRFEDSEEVEAADSWQDLFGIKKEENLEDEEQSAEREGEDQRSA